MINWKKLCEDSHFNAKEKGFLDIERSFNGDIALIHSEISEALEDYRNHHKVDELYFEDKNKVQYSNLELAQKTSLDPGKSFKPCGIPIEFADVVIRVAQYCGSNHLDLAYAMHMVKTPAPAVGDFEELCARLHLEFSKVYEEWLEKNAVNEFGFARALLILEDYCRGAKIDLEGAVKMKAAYNATRPYRHGGKHI